MIAVYAKPDEAITAGLVPDDTVCQVAITCSPAPIGFHLDEDYEGRERLTWATVVVLKATEDDSPVLSCEDCAGWLEDVFRPAPPPPLPA